MDLGIAGKRVLVTGASQGIGRAIALDFAREGCRVAVVARREDKLQELVAEIGGIERGHAYYAADLMEPDAPTRVAEELLAQAGVFSTNLSDVIDSNIGVPVDHVGIIVLSCHSTVP